MATASLRRDHDLIMKVCRSMEVAAQMLRDGRGVPAPILGQVVSFARDFTDACHHAKEEGSLFPALEAAGMPRRAGPLAVMLAEHERSRELAARMEESARAYAAGGPAGRVADDMQAYADHVGAHIWKENSRLFAMADERLRGSGGAVEEGLGRIEAERLRASGRGRGHYEAAAEEIARAAPPPDPSAGPTTDWERQS